MLAPIQLILLLVLLSLVYGYIRLFRYRWWGVAMVVLWFSAGCLAVLFPEYTNRLANLLGVGRGADLLLYMAVVTFVAVSGVLFSRLRKIEERQTEILRLLALQTAKAPEEDEEE